MASGLIRPVKTGQGTTLTTWAGSSDVAALSADARGNAEKGAGSHPAPPSTCGGSHMEMAMSLEPFKPSTGAVVRFHDKYRVDHITGCWLWLAAKLSGGYGVLKDGDYRWMTHRLSWIIHNGSIPQGMCVLHHCDVPSCVNPAHLFLGTKADNVADMDQKGRARRDLCGQRGEEHRCAKLNTAVILDIRASEDTPNDLARKYGVCAGHIRRIRKEKRWRGGSVQRAPLARGFAVARPLDAAPAFLERTWP